MGGLVITETIIENAPAALNLIGQMIQWLNQLDDVASVRMKDSSHHGGRTRMRRGKMVTDASEGTSDDMANLLDDLATTVRSLFVSNYTYSYNGADSLPPSAELDSNGNPVKLVPGEDFTCCAKNSASSIASYVDTNIITSNLPAWAQAKLRNELIGYLTQILSAEPTNAWVSSPQPKTITNSASGQTIQADIVLLYCVTPAPDPKNVGQNVNTLFVKYIGVYYLGSSWGLSRGIEYLPPAAQILAIGITISTILATAAATHIIRSQPDSVVVTTNFYTGQLKVVVANKGETNSGNSGGSGQLANSDIPVSWLISALGDAGIGSYNIQTRAATSDEFQELHYLDQWQAKAAMAKGDFSALKY